MRHRVYGKHLGRTKNERLGLFRNLVQALVLSEKIETTESKAKAVKGLVDKLINQAKSPSTKRLVSQFLVNKKASDKLVNDLVPRLQSRNSGYSSITKLGRRLGDGAMVVQMKLLLEEEKTKDTKLAKKTDEKQAKTQQNRSEVKTERQTKTAKPKKEAKK